MQTTKRLDESLSICANMLFYTKIFNSVYVSPDIRWLVVKLQTSDIRVTYEYIRRTFGCHTSTYEWQRDDIRVHTSNIRMTYEYIRMSHGWHYEWHTDDLLVTSGWHTCTYEWHTNGIRIACKITINCIAFEAFTSSFLI